MTSSENGPAMAAPRTARWPGFIAVGGLVVAVFGGWVTWRAGATWPVIAQDQLVGLAFLLAGTMASHRRPNNLIGPLLLLTGYTWYIPDFQSSSSPWIASLAYANRRLVNAISTYLLLAFPSGRLGSPAARISIGVLVAGTFIDNPARLLLTARIPADLGHLDRVAPPGCDCSNPFFMADDPALLAAIEYQGGIGSVGNAVFVIGIIIYRLATATPAMRRVLVPVVLAALVGAAVFALNLSIAFGTIGHTPPVVNVLRWIITLARVAVPLGFLIGLLRMKMDRAAVADLVVGMHGRRVPGSLRAQIAGALRDPTVEIGLWSAAAGSYVDEAGKALNLPASGSGRSVTHVKGGETPLGAIVHDAALDDDHELLKGVSAAFAINVDRERLTTSLRAQSEDALRLPSGPVTLLYADVEGSTELLARLGERYADVLSEERRILRAVVRDTGGIEIDSRADEFFAVFAQDASPIDAALEIHRRLRDRAWPEGVAVKVRIGLHGGEPQRTNEGYVGLDVHRASRIGSAGHGAQTLLSQAARDRLHARLPPGASLRLLGVYRLKGLAEADPIWQLEVADLAREFPPLRASEGGSSDPRRDESGPAGAAVRPAPG